MRSLTAIRRFLCLVALLAALPGQGHAQSAPDFKVYVTLPESNSVAIIDGLTNTVVSTIAVPAGAGTGPFSVALTPDAKFAYIVNGQNCNDGGPFGYNFSGTNPLQGFVWVLDTVSSSTVAVIPVDICPQEIAITPEGTRAYVTNFGSNTLSVIDIPSNTVLTSVGLPDTPDGLVITPDGSSVYVATFTSVSVISTATNTIVGNILPPDPSCDFSELAVTPDGQQIYVTSNGCASAFIISTQTNSVVFSFPSQSFLNPWGVAITPDGKEAYLTSHDGQFGLPQNSNFGETFVIDTSTLAFAPHPMCRFDIGTPSACNRNGVDTGTSLPIFVEITPDGKEAYFSANLINPVSGALMVLDTATNIATASVLFNTVPGGMAIGPANNTPAGTNIAVQPLDGITKTSPVTLTFSSVTQAGFTSLVLSSAGPTPPSGFQLGNPPIYYHLGTTAAFLGNVVVCINYATVNFGSSPVALNQFENNTWVDVTTSVDAVNQIICGSVTSLGPFAIFEGGAPPLTFSSASRVTFTVGNSGSFLVTAIGTPAPSYSESGVLPSGVSFVDNGNGAATLSGTPAAGVGGTYLLTFTAHNGVAPDGLQSFTLTVNQPPAISSTSNAIFTEGTSGSFQFAATGFPIVSLTESGTLPTGVSFVDNGNGTATLAGAPATGTHGTYTFTVIAANGVGTNATQTFTLTVAGGSLLGPTITSASGTVFTVLAQSSFLITASGSPTPALAEAGPLPTGVTFTDNNNGTASLAGTPGAGTAGTYSFTVTASNVVGASTQVFTLNVNIGVAITSGNGTTFTVGSMGNFTITAVGTTTPTLTETGALPAGITFTDNGNGTATLRGTPAVGTVGSYPIVLGASTNTNTATQNFALTVNQGPAITSGSATTLTIGVPGSFLVTSTGTPFPAFTEMGPLPAGITFVDNGNGTATLSGVSATGTGGNYPLTITAANGVGTNATQVFTLTISQGLAITSGSMTTFTVGSPGFFSVTTTGSPVPTLVEVGGLPTGVTFVDNANGTATLSGTPGALTGGSYGFTITASNGGAGPDATQSFTLTVNQGAAIITGNSTTFTVGVQGSFTVETTGVPKAALSENGALPSGVTFADNGDGTATLSGTPASGSAVSYSITISANNGVDAPAMQSFTLNVNQGPAITSTNSTTFSEQIAGSFTITAAGNPTPALTETGNLPTGVTFLDNGNGSATLGGTPAAGTSAQYGFTVRASNGISPDATQTFTLTVSKGLNITSPNATALTVGTAGSFTVTTTGLPTPSLAETGTLPAGVAFIDNRDGTATLAGSPVSGSGGIYSLNFAAHNGVSPDATQTFTLTVYEAPQFSSAPAASFGIGAPSFFTVKVSGFPIASSLSAGGKLPLGVSFHNNGDGTGTLSGTPAQGTQGTYAITFTVGNSAGLSATQSFKLTIFGQAAPAFTSASKTTFAAGVKNSFTITTTGVPTPALTLPPFRGLPGGVSFRDNHDGTATLEGIPAISAQGTYHLTITATGAGGVTFAAVQHFILTVRFARPPQFTSADHTAFTEGTFGSFTVTTINGLPIPELTEPDALPLGVTFTDNHDGTATLSGIPASRTGGQQYQLRMTANNGVSGNPISHDVVQPFILDVLPQGMSAPAFTSANKTAFAVGVKNSFTITTTGSPKPKLTLRALPALPGALSFHDNGDGTATLEGIPAISARGAFHLTITATGAGGAPLAAVQNFMLTVQFGRPPQFTSADHTAFTEGTFGSFKVTTINGLPIPKLTELDALPRGVTFTDNHDGTATLSGIPASATRGQQYQLHMAANNGVGGKVSHDVVQPFILGVLPPGMFAPTFTSANKTTFGAGVKNAFTITTTGVPTPALTFVPFRGLPQGVSFHDNHDGTATLDGIPAIPARGTYHFTITATGAGGATFAAVQSFTLTVRLARPPQFTSADHTAFTEGTFGSFTVTTINGLPIPKLTEPDTLPLGVTFTDNHDGTATLSGVPAPRTARDYPLPVTANNGVGGMPSNHDVVQKFSLLVLVP